MRIRGFAPSTPCWVELTTTDTVRAGGFYAELFGWQVDGARFTLGGKAVAGLGVAEPDRPSGWVTYLAAPELDETVERLGAAGGSTLTEPEQRDGARCAVVTDAGGALFGLWQAEGFTGAQVRGEPGAMAWSDLLTDDVDAATSFYGSVFGWSLTHEFGSGEWLTEAHDSVAGLVSGRRGARWQASFQVTDCREVLERCERLGGRVVARPVEQGLGCYAELADPDGVRFAITAPVERPVELSVAYHEIAGLELTYNGL